MASLTRPHSSLKSFPPFPFPYPLLLPFQAGALDKLEAFTSFNGPDFYGLPRNSRRVTLIRQPWAVPDSYPYSDGGSLVPMLAGEQLEWQGSQLSGATSEAPQHSVSLLCLLHALLAPVSLRPGLPHDSLPFDQLQQKHIRPHHFCLPVLKRETHRAGGCYSDPAAPEGRVAATVTPQHPLRNLSALFAGGIRPHPFCLPVLMRERHTGSFTCCEEGLGMHTNERGKRITGQAIVAAVTGGSTRFFLGTDSAPHERATKEAPCGCAGIFSAHAALPLYPRAFEQVSVRCY
ncbi:unnamed protein product [Closterium sp. Naga37s-1]|nr:unnamed protein product [Closterium sp. Naga37s-1]